LIKRLIAFVTASLHPIFTQKGTSVHRRIVSRPIAMPFVQQATSRQWPDNAHLEAMMAERSRSVDPATNTCRAVPKNRPNETVHTHFTVHSRIDTKYAAASRENMASCSGAFLLDS
jgi:hypothetical protein